MRGPVSLQGQQALWQLPLATSTWAAASTCRPAEMVRQIGVTAVRK